MKSITVSKYAIACAIATILATSAKAGLTVDWSGQPLPGSESPYFQFANFLNDNSANTVLLGDKNAAVSLPAPLWPTHAWSSFSFTWDPHSVNNETLVVNKWGASEKTLVNNSNFGNPIDQIEITASADKDWRHFSTLLQSLQITSLDGTRLLSIYGISNAPVNYDLGIQKLAIKDDSGLLKDGFILTGGMLTPSPFFNSDADDYLLNVSLGSEVSAVPEASTIWAGVALSGVLAISSVRRKTEKRRGIDGFGN